MLRNKNGLTEQEFLSQYKPGDYERPSVTVDMLLFTIMDEVSEDVKKLNDKKLKLLLIKRNDHPFIGQWAIPGGFVDIHESIEDAVYRELKEETNVEDVYMEQLFTWGEVNRDPRMRVISSSYMALVNHKGLKPIAGDDAGDVAWFTVSKELISESNDELNWRLSLTSEEKDVSIVYEVTDKFLDNGIIRTKQSELKALSSNQDLLAFDHADIVNMAMDRLKNKVEYTPIAFNLVDEYFTLREIQQVYEVILGKELNRGEFRRKTKDMVVETEKMCTSKGFRPAKYYKFNKDYKQYY